MLTLDNTLIQLQEGGYGSVTLYYYPSRTQSFKVGVYTSDSEDDNREMVENLARVVLRYPNDTKFEVEALNTKKSQKETANRWQFSQDGTDKFAKPVSVPGVTQVQPQNTFSGLGTLDPSTNPLWLMIEGKKTELEKDRRELDREINQFEIKKARFEDEQKTFKEFLKQKNTELGELETTYKSNSAAAKNGIETLLRELILEFGQKGHVGGVAGRLMGLGAATEEQSTEEAATPEDKVIEDIAVMIQGHKLKEEQLTKLGGTINHYIINKIKSNGIPEKTEI